MKNPTKQVKVGSCEALIKIKKRYLTVAMYCLQEEFSKEKVNNELVYCLCDYVSAINKVITYFEALIEDHEEPMLTITYTQAILAKTYMLNFKMLKQILMKKHLVLVELN